MPDSLWQLVGPRSSQHGKQLSSSLPVQQIHQGLLGDRHKAHSTSGTFSKPILPPGNSSNVSLGDIPNPQKNATGVPATVLSSSSGFLHSSRAITSSMQHSSTTGFGSALNIETLVVTAERRDTSIEEFSPDGRFIISTDRDFKIRVIDDSYPLKQINY
ncbi:uncharacterized protein LOC114283310 isoform X1 [Camellia sinensis]|uniref:uncharacterized protein LOC114283310 isoform X1 n=1 Tax=Camellia sinensis TaxID=4442 RepID=UPI0010358AEC|nr:uncharacterized protein LOC114283310 isoform X1 [Camellia sinensis]